MTHEQTTRGWLTVDYTDLNYMCILLHLNSFELFGVDYTDLDYMLQEAESLYILAFERRGDSKERKKAGS